MDKELLEYQLIRITENLLAIVSLSIRMSKYKYVSEEYEELRAELNKNIKGFIEHL